ncbi:MAG: putative lipid II flippase FtsW [bacterium]
MVQNKLKSDVRILLVIVSLLIILGLIFIYSASSVYALEKFGAAHYFLKKQIIYLCLGIISFLIFAILPMSFWKKHIPIFFLISLLVTSMTMLPKTGFRIHGSSRWLSLFGFSFQPSEFLKLFLFMYIGYFLEKKQKKIESFWNSYLPFLMILGVTFVILLKQPDFGSVITIFATSVALLFIAEFNILHLFITVMCSFPLIIALIYSQKYRLDRILIFLNPWADPKGRGFQIIQSLIAIGSGSLWGLGISNSRQKFFYLPMQHTDFIFSIIAEETGFVGSCFIILLYLLFCYFGLRIALQLKENLFAFFTTLGFVVLICLQACVNLMVTTGLLPTKGLGLPFVSYGGTSLIAVLSMIGLIVNFSRKQRW